MIIWVTVWWHAYGRWGELTDDQAGALRQLGVGLVALAISAAMLFGAIAMLEAGW